MNHSDVISKLISYYEDHPNDFADDLESLDKVNRQFRVFMTDRCLGNDRRYPMGELDRLLSGKSPSDVLLFAYCGGDDGEESFNPSRAYFYFNGYGGIISTDERDYRRGYLNNGTVAVIVNNAPRLHLSKGAQDIIDEHNN